MAGRGQVSFVTGGAGTGKTALVGEFARRAQETHSDLVVALGNCNARIGIGDPYLPFREILALLIGDVGAKLEQGAVSEENARRLQKLAVRAGQVLIEVAPEIAGLFLPGAKIAALAGKVVAEKVGWTEKLDRFVESKEKLGQAQAAVVQNRIFEQYTQLLQMVAVEQPLMLVLDDLQWADASSVALLFHLGRRIYDSPILVLGSYRPEDVALGRGGERHPLESVLNELKRHYGDVWVDLDRAGQAEGRHFVDALLDSEPNELDRAFRERLFQQTGGHPLFTVELLRAMQARGDLTQDEAGRWNEGPTLDWHTLPARVEGVIEERIDRLDDESREAVTIASVEGEAFTAEVVARVQGADERDFIRYLSSELERRHRLVRAERVRRLGKHRLSLYRFWHKLFQDYLYDGLGEVERSYLHEDVGNVLEEFYREEPEALVGVAPQLALHFEKAGTLDRALSYLKQSGDAAARIYANTEAIAHYSRAIDIARRLGTCAEDLSPLYMRLGRSLELNAEYDRVLATYEEMEKVARQLEDRSMALASLVARVTIRAVPSVVHDPGRARMLGGRALALARELNDQAAEARILWSLSLAHYFENQLAEAIDHGERSLTLARELDLREQTAQTLNDLGGLIYLHSGRIPQAIDALEEAGGLWEEMGNRPMLADSLSGASTAYVYAGEYDRAIALSEQAFDISRSIENVWGQSYSQMQLVDVALERGDYGRAISLGEECIRLGERAGFIVSQMYARISLALVYADLGLVGRALELINEARKAASEQDLTIGSALILGYLARLQIASGRLDEAAETIAEAKGEPYRESWVLFRLPVHVADVEYMIRQGELGRAALAADELITRLREHGVRSNLPEALYLKGKALQALGQREPARKSYVEALAEARAMGAGRILWRILRALSLVEDDPSEAGRWQGEARRVIENIANQIGDGTLRASFLNRADVQTVLQQIPLDESLSQNRGTATGLTEPSMKHVREKEAIEGPDGPSD
jgi:predicted ATPase/predicted negative regulator of RcsB-dependent stress response